MVLPTFLNARFVYNIFICTAIFCISAFYVLFYLHHLHCNSICTKILQDHFVFPHLCHRCLRFIFCFYVVTCDYMLQSMNFCKVLLGSWNQNFFKVFPKNRNILIRFLIFLPFYSTHENYLKMIHHKRTTMLQIRENEIILQYFCLDVLQMV